MQEEKLLQLASDLAQSALEADFYDVMNHDAPDKAQMIRRLSEENNYSSNYYNSFVQDYRKYQRAIYIALKKLDCVKVLEEIIEAFREAIAEDGHDFDMSDDEYLSQKRRRLLNAIKKADNLFA